MPLARKSSAILILLAIANSHLLAAKMTVTRGVTKTTSFELHYETFRLKSNLGDRIPTVILLHGAGGLQSSNFPFQDLIHDLASNGYAIVLPSFEDVTFGSLSHPEAHYGRWVQATKQLIDDLLDKAHTNTGHIALVEYSLGSSIALGLAATDSRVSAVVECSGSFPDDFLTSKTTLPPLLILHNQDDPVIPIFNAMQLKELCNARRLACESHIEPLGAHRFRGQSAILLRRRILDFLARVM